MRFAATVGIMLLAGGCFGTHWAPFNVPPRAPTATNPAAIEVFSSRLPSRPYVELGLLESDKGGLEEPSDAILRLKEEAGRRGCDGLIMGGGYVRHVWGTSFVNGFRATCILFTDGRSAEPAPVAPPARVEPSSESAPQWQP